MSLVSHDTFRAGDRVMVTGASVRDFSGASVRKGSRGEVISVMKQSYDAHPTLAAVKLDSGKYANCYFKEMKHVEV